MTLVVGVDASLTRTGVAVYDSDTSTISVHSFGSSASGEDVSERYKRIKGISSRVFDSVFDADPTRDVLVAIEGPAFSSNTGKVWDRAGLWWDVVGSLIDRARVIEIPPTSRAKYATGNGRAGKDEVLIAVGKTYPEVDFSNNDEADALILAAMAARLIGKEFDGDLPKNKLDAMEKLRKANQWEQ